MNVMPGGLLRKTYHLQQAHLLPSNLHSTMSF